MNYHLNRNGESLGVFSLDELRRKRKSGELKGTEIVWHQGLADWQPIDFVLAPPNGRRNRSILWVIAAGLVVTATAIGGVPLVYQLIEQLAVWESKKSLSPKGIEVTGPVAVELDTSTIKDTNEKARDFRRRHYVEGYKRDGNRDHACDAESVLYLKAWIAFHFGGEAPEMNLSFGELGERITNSECADPLVLAIAAMNLDETHDKTKHLEPIWETLMSSNHKSYPKFWITVALADLVKDQWRRNVLEDSAVQLFEQILDDENFFLAEREVLAENLVHGWGKSFFRRRAAEICSIAKTAKPESEWLALVLEGEWHIIRAWRARGGGFAHKVTQEGWSGFREHLAQARTSLEPAWERHPEFPITASRMISVAMGESDPTDMRLWFDRSVAARIDYPQAWARMRWGLRPRWHGSHEAMLALGTAAIDTGRFDTDVPRKFFDVLTDLGKELSLPAGEYIYGRDDIWPHLQRMYEGYLAEHAGQPGEDGWRSAYVGVAYLAGKYDIARGQLEVLDWKPRPGPLTWWKIDLSLMPLEVGARTGSHGTDIAQAEIAWKEGDRSKALQLYKAISESDPDQQTHEFVQHRLAALDR